MPIIVFNKNADGCDFSWCDEAVNVMRPSILGNPFPISASHTRQQVIARYDAYLSKAIENHGSQQALEIRRLAELHQQGKNIALVCCCSPLPCHADIIKVRVLAYPSIISVPQSSNQRKFAK